MDIQTDIWMGGEVQKRSICYSIGNNNRSVFCYVEIKKSK